MKKMKQHLGIWGLIFFSLIALAMICGLALADPEGMLVLPILLLAGAALVVFSQRMTLIGMRGALGATAGMLKMLKSSAAMATAFTIAKFGADDDHCAAATAATDKFVGVIQDTCSAAEAEMSIMLNGISPVVYGGAVTRGDPLTSDASGRAITATADGQTIIGRATISGVLNDIGFVEIGIQTHYGVQATAGNTFKQLAIATFDPSANAGERTIASHGLGVYLPDNAIITRAWYEVLTTFADGVDDSATIALSIPTDDVAGIVAATAISAGGNVWDAGNHEAIQTGTAANFSEKCTAERELTATVAVAALTAGKLRLYAEYVISI